MVPTSAAILAPEYVSKNVRRPTEAPKSLHNPSNNNVWSLTDSVAFRGGCSICSFKASPSNIITNKIQTRLQNVNAYTTNNYYA